MNKTVLITGGSRGIGRAAARLFAKESYQVVINYLNAQNQAMELCEELNKQGCSVMAVRADVAVRSEVRAMVNEAQSRFGAVDCLVNNAGIGSQKLFTDISEAEWDRMLDVNLKGVFNCCQAVLPMMIHQKRGKIINISSIWGLSGASCEVHYSAAKAGVIGLTKALAKELGPSNIQVNCIAPGVIETEMNRALSEEDKKALIDETPLLRLGTPEDIAHAIYFLASEKADFFTGQVLSPNGGYVI